MDFVFITDTHFKLKSSIRTGDILEDLTNKLKCVVDYCNSLNASLLFGGDLFDTPSQPDIVKYSILNELRRMTNPVYGTMGNHDLLYGNAEYNNKTSWNILTSTGIIKEVVEDMDLGEVVLSTKRHVTDKGKPCITLFHGFLNKEDGVNTFLYSDIDGNITHDTAILLGHDHAEYEPVEYTPRIIIYRIGSMCRATREVASLRTPKMLHLHVEDGTITTELVPIPCRDADDIFITKVEGISNSVKEASYADLINQISTASSQQWTLRQALENVCDATVVEYASHLLERARAEEQTKKDKL